MPGMDLYYQCGSHSKLHVFLPSFHLGQAEMNKFLLVITAEADSAPKKHAGPTVLHGTSPSGWLQSFLNHPLFRGITG